MNARTSSNPTLTASSMAGPSGVRGSTAATAEACAHCGAALLQISGATCDHCHFVYCSGHATRDDHLCVDICLDCPPAWED